jgi:hypothetical protein
MSAPNGRHPADAADTLARLNAGIAWASAGGRENLASLLDGIRRELERFRASADQAAAPGLAPDLDAEDIECALQDLSGRVAVLEKQMADVTEDIAGLRSELARLVSESGE